MSPSSTVHGGQYDTKYVTVEFFAFCFLFCLASSSSFSLFSVSFFLLPWCSWWRSLFGLVRISVLHPSRCLRARNLRKSAYSLVCFISCFPACFFFSLFPFWFWFRFRFRFFDVELFFFFILSFSCGYYAVLSVSVATCTAYRMYLIRTCADLTFIFVWGVRCGSAIMCIILCYIFIFSEVFFHSRVIGACPATTDCIVLWRWVNVRTTTTTYMIQRWYLRSLECV